VLHLHIWMVYRCFLNYTHFPPRKQLQFVTLYQTAPCSGVGNDLEMNFSFKTTLERKAPLPFSRHEAFFTQFLLYPLTLLFIGGRLLHLKLSESDALILLHLRDNALAWKRDLRVQANPVTDLVGNVVL
jgi:hypothetical protein